MCKPNPSRRIVRQLGPVPACVLLRLAIVHIFNMCHGVNVSRHALCDSGKQSMTRDGRQGLEAMQSTLPRESCAMRVPMARATSHLDLVVSESRLGVTGSSHQQRRHDR